MADDNEKSLHQPGLAPAVVLSALVAVISVVTTLLVSNMQTVQGKADKADVSDRWTGTMERIKTNCETQKERLRAEREIMRTKVTSNEILALDWKMQWLSCENRWRTYVGDDKAIVEGYIE